MIKAKNELLWGNPCLQAYSQTVSPRPPLSWNLSPPSSLPILEPPCHGEFVHVVVPAWLFHFPLSAVHRPLCSWLTLNISLSFSALAVFVKLCDGQTDSHFSFMFSLRPFKIFSAWEESKEGEKTPLHICLAVFCEKFQLMFWGFCSFLMVW